MNIIIAGAGIAGLNAAKAARETNPNCNIKLIDSGDKNTYQRTRIPDYIAGTIGLKELFQYDDEWYNKNRIDFIKNANISDISVDNKTITASGIAYQYDSLIIATGSSSFIPPIKGSEKKNVFAVRTIEDADRVKQVAGPDKVFTIIGGGLLGLEMSWAIKQTGSKVNILEAGQRLLPRQCDEEGALLLFSALQEKGINIYLNAQTEEICGAANSDLADSIKLTNGTVIATDYVILSTGVRANFDWIKSSAIESGRAIKVNDKMLTSAEDIYAAGDVAEYDGKNFSIWPIAVAQGKVAGVNAAGGSMIYNEVFPYTQLKIKDITMFSIGNITPDACDIQCKKAGSGKHVKLFIKDGIIIGAIVFGEPLLPMKIKKTVDNKTVVAEISSELQADDILAKL